MNLYKKIFLVLGVWVLAIVGIISLNLSETVEIVSVAMTTTIAMQFAPKRKIKEKIIAE